MAFHWRRAWLPLPYGACGGELLTEHSVKGQEIPRSCPYGFLHYFYDNGLCHNTQREGVVRSARGRKGTVLLARAL